MKNFPGAIGGLPIVKCFPGIEDAKAVSHIADRVNNIDWKARGEEIHEGLRQASVEMMVISHARGKACRDLYLEVNRATDAYRDQQKLEGFSPEMFSMCRYAGNETYGWIVSNDTGERVCEWRWNELRFEGAKAIMSFNFSAFDGLTTKDI